MTDTELSNDDEIDLAIVVKVQMPLGGDMTRALIKDRTGLIEAFVPVEGVAADMAGDVKAYFVASLRLNAEGQPQIKLNERVEQDW